MIRILIMWNNNGLNLGLDLNSIVELGDRKTRLTLFFLTYTIRNIPVRL